MNTIPFSPPDITQAEIDEVVDALQSGWITTGPKTKQLEKLVAQYCHTDRAACLNSATACLELTLRMLGVGPGDEVIVPAYTYTASASVVAHVGAELVLVDCEQGKYTMDFAQVERAINSNTKAIIPVSLFGIPTDYQRLYEVIENKRHLFTPSENKMQRALGRVAVVSDCAHSFGATYHGKTEGEIADFSCFSFHAVKNLTTAEGGAVTWRKIDGVDPEEMYRQYMLYSLHGQNKDALAKTKAGQWEYDICGLWYKCNMTDVHAAIGIAQINRYQQILQRRRSMIERYNCAFADLPIETADHYTDGYSSSGHLYVMRLKGASSDDRNQFIQKMAQLGVTTNVHYKPLPLHTGYRKLGFDIKDYPNAYHQYENEVTLPLHTLLTDEEVAYIIECVKKCL